MIYVIYPEKVVAFMGFGQWVSYNKYENWNRLGISHMIKRLVKSNEDEYASPSELIQLASECNIVGSSTTKPKELL